MERAPPWLLVAPIRVSVAPQRGTILIVNRIPMMTRVNHLWHSIRGAPYRLVRLALALALLVTLVRSDAIPPSQRFDYQLGIVITGLQFDLAAWEVQALTGKGRQVLAREAAALSLREREARVRAFFTRVGHIRDLEGELQRIHSTAPAPGAGSRQQATEAAQALQAELDALRREQAREQGMVEAILENQVGAMLAEEGFAVGPIVWPPVSFRLTEPPTLLIISPRQEITRKAEAQLRPRLPLAEREQLEDSIDDTFDVSSLVDDLGGLSAFPTIVLFSTSILNTVDTVAHEWTHHYLFFNPLGWHYYDSGDLTTMNETAASVVGQEVARKTMVRYYPDLVPPPPARSDAAVRPPSEEKLEFDFNYVMRQTRLEVDRLLAAGKVEQAEDYMESQRRLVVQHGYYLRKLNQAYFAFHGSYATSATSVDPIGPQMQRLRAASPSLRAFLRRVSQMRSHADLEQALRSLEAD
jgi:hypothetical protein